MSWDCSPDLAPAPSHAVVGRFGVYWHGRRLNRGDREGQQYI